MMNSKWLEQKAREFDERILKPLYRHGRVTLYQVVRDWWQPVLASFSLGPIASTEMAGPEPAMRAESAYQTLLGQARSCKMAADTLTLYDAGGNPSLIFASQNK